MELAHVGADHILVFLVPVALAILAMRLVEKRAERRAEAAEAEGDTPGP